MPVNAARFEIGGRPIRPRRGLGSKGSIRAHKASSRSRLDLRMADRTKRPHPVQGLRHQTFETRSKHDRSWLRHQRSSLLSAIVQSG